MNDSSTANLTATLQQTVTQLLADHAYGVCELAKECAERLHEPMCELMTPLADSLCDLVKQGMVRYDREHNQVLLA